MDPYAYAYAYASAFPSPPPPAPPPPQVVEPAGAIALAALLSPQWRQLCAEAEARGAPLRRVAAVSCGGNAEISQLAALCAEVR